MYKEIAEIQLDKDTFQEERNDLEVGESDESEDDDDL